MACRRGGVITVRTGRSEGDQETSFQNATLQGRGPIAFSVATFVELPASLPLTEADVAESLTAVLGALAHEAQRRCGVTVSFEVEVGAAADGEWS